MTATKNRSRRWRAALATLVATAGVTATMAGPAPARADQAEPEPAGLIGWWKLDETSGAVAADSSGNDRDGTVTGATTWNAGDGFTFSGGANSSGNSIRLPDDLLAGTEDLTVDFDVWVDPTLSGNWFMYNLGNSATYPDGTGYLFTTNDSSNRYRATIAEGGFPTEQSASRPGKIATGVWKHVTYTIEGGTPDAPGSARLYEDGVLVASKDDLTTSPALLGAPDGSTTLNRLGRSAYSGDQSFKGRLRDFRLYARVLTAAESATLAEDAVVPALDADAAALTLGDTSAVASDLTLPATGASSTTSVSWISSDPALVSGTGVIARPTYGEPAASATLTATLVRGTESRTRTFEVTVLPDDLDDTGKAQEAVAAVELVHPDDVRGNLTLPTAGLHGSALAWASGSSGVVTATGEVTRPPYGASAVDVTLTVTATKGTATASRDVVVRVRPAPDEPDYEGYAFAYFAGESTDDGEKIHFGASRGNDPLDYDELNDGLPVLSSSFGEQGLRDPFIIRSHEGDRFFLLATDLKGYPSVDFGEAQETGSKYVEVWESTDLVHWSDQRHIKVSSDFAGNTWAPEAFYDEDAGEYLVYWASALYPTTSTAGRDINTSYQQMMYATTRDFVTFSDPQPWIDVKRGTGRGMIDATVVKDGDTFYRVVKDEASMTPRQERSTDLRAVVSGSLPTTTSTPGWQLVKEQVGVGQPNPWGGSFTNGEGPTVFRDNEDPDRWYLFIDQPSYHGGQGYLAFTTDDIGAGSWTSVPNADLPSSPRHGTVIPVTQAELDVLRAGFQPELLIEDVADVSVTTRPGVAPELPATVSAGLGDGSSADVAVVWDEVDPASYAGAGTFTVTGTVSRGSADRPVATVTVAEDLVATTVVAVAGDTTVRFGTDLPIAVRVTAPGGVPTGSVRAISAGKVLASANLANGRARMVIDTARLAGVGRHTIILRYDGSATHRAGEDRVELTLAPARSAIALAVAKPDRSGRGGVVKVRVVTDPAGVEVARVLLKVRRNGVVVRRVNAALDARGALAWSLPRLRKGRWSVQATVPHTPSVTGSNVVRRFTVR